MSLLLPRRNSDRATMFGHLRAWVITPDPDAVIVEGLDWNQKGWKRLDNGEWVSAPMARPNAFVNSGLQLLLDRWLTIGTPGASPTRIAVSSDNTAVTAATLTFGGTFRSNTFNATFPSRSAQTASIQSDFTKGAGSNQIDFSVRKIGATNASTDASGAVQDIIGGAGVSPYAEVLTIDLTSTSSFTFRPQIDFTLSAL